MRHVIRRRAVPFLLLACCLVGAATVLARPRAVPPGAAELGRSVAALTAPELEGRRSGTAGGDRAAELLAGWLGAAGLRPAGDHGTFLQSFVLERSALPAPTSALELDGAPPRAFALGRDFTPHAGSQTGEAAGEIVFVGYGVSAPDAGWDDWAAVDLRGRVALALDGAPPSLAGARASRIEKVLAARAHGAAALLLVADALPPVAATSAPVNVLSAAVTRAAADALLAPAGRTTAELAAALTGGGAPASFATGARARLRVDLLRHERRAQNVVGVLPGVDPARAGDAVVLGAHWDHLGRVGGVVHPGADDNASGTALVVGLARAFAATGGADRTLVFVLFGAEELGLLGSAHYVRQPVVPLAQTVAMLNFDMVGRLRRDRLFVSGGDSASGLRALVTEAARGTGVTLDVRGSPWMPSDQTRFYGAGVPVLSFFTGAHDDYHRPSDTPDRLDPDGMARVAAVAARAVERLAGEPRPVYARVAPPAPGGAPADTGLGGAAFLGIVAAPRPAPDGLWISGVVPGSAAAAAGLREGDVIVRFDRDAVDGLDALRTLLSARRPGQTVDVVYLRGGEAHRTAATLGEHP